MIKITYDEQRALARYMLNRWEDGPLTEAELDALEAEVDSFIECDAAGAPYPWKVTPARWVDDLMERVAAAGSYKFLEDNE